MCSRRVEARSNCLTASLRGRTVRWPAHQTMSPSAATPSSAQRAMQLWAPLPLPHLREPVAGSRSSGLTRRRGADRRPRLGLAVTPSPPRPLPWAPRGRGRLTRGTLGSALSVFLLSPFVSRTGAHVFGRAEVPVIGYLDVTSEEGAAAAIQALRLAGVSLPCGLRTAARPGPAAPGGRFGAEVSARPGARTRLVPHTRARRRRLRRGPAWTRRPRSRVHAGRPVCSRYLPARSSGRSTSRRRSRPAASAAPGGRAPVTALDASRPGRAGRRRRLVLAAIWL